MDDSEHQHDPLLIVDLEHDPEVADTEPVEHILGPVDRLDQLARDPSQRRGLGSQPLQVLADSIADIGAQCGECTGGRPTKPDVVWGQGRSSRLIVRPWA
jgi:hypothetical protein